MRPINCGMFLSNWSHSGSGRVSIASAISCRVLLMVFAIRHSRFLGNQ